MEHIICSEEEFFVCPFEEDELSEPPDEELFVFSGEELLFFLPDEEDEVFEEDEEEVTADEVSEDETF